MKRKSSTPVATTPEAPSLVKSPPPQSGSTTGSSRGATRGTVERGADSGEGRESLSSTLETGASDLGQKVSESLRRLRRDRGLTLDQLAASSGVSRAALSQIEGGRTNPTLSVLWKIATGLSVPFETLLGIGSASRTRVQRAGDAPVVRSSDGKVESRLRSPVGAGQSMGVYELRVAPHGVLLSEPHGPSATETVVVLVGSLRVSVGDESLDLGPGDTLFFRADVTHSYENRGTTEARCLDIISYAA